MVGRKVALELLEEDNKRLEATYDGWVKGLKNKTRELSTLCDVPVLLISFGPTGTTFTWPEDREEVCALISKFGSCDMGSRKRGIRRQLGGSSNDLQVVAREEQKHTRTSPEASSSISADLLQDERLEKMTLREVMFLSMSIDRASRMIEEKIKSLDHDHKCHLHGRELEIVSSLGPQDHEGSSSSSEKLTCNATEVDHHQIITYNDQVVGMTISYVDNSMVHYPVIVANDVDHQLDVMRGVTPPALLAPDLTIVCERSNDASRNDITVGEIGATWLDRQIIPHNNNNQQLDMQADDDMEPQVTIPDGQIESICSEATTVASEIGLLEPQMVMIMTPSHDHQVLSPCHLDDLTMCDGVDPFMAPSLVTHSQMTAHHPDHAGYSLQQEEIFNYSFPSTPQQFFFIDDEQQPEIDDMYDWIPLNDDIFFLW